MSTKFSIGDSKNETKQQYIFFLKFFLLIIAYGINGTTYTSIPFLFYRSILTCVDKNGQYYECSVEQACQNKYGYIVCIFASNPSEKQTKHQDISSINDLMSLLLTLFPVIVAKISFESTWIVSYQKYVIPTSYQQLQFSFSNIITIFFKSGVPFYKYVSTTLKFNPFIGFDVLSLLESFLSTKYEEIKQNEEMIENEKIKSINKELQILMNFILKIMKQKIKFD